MVGFVTLACLSCGEKLQISNNFSRFVCGHCGREHIVKREGGTISLVPVIKKVRIAAKKNVMYAKQMKIIGEKCQKCIGVTFASFGHALIAYLQIKAAGYAGNVGLN